MSAHSVKTMIVAGVLLVGTGVLPIAPTNLATAGAVADCTSPTGLGFTTGFGGALTIPGVVPSLQRDQGVSLQVGSNVVYAFGDHVPSGRSNSAAWGDPTYTDTVLIEANGGGPPPAQWIPLDATDVAYNASHSNKILMWPFSLARTTTGAAVFYTHIALDSSNEPQPVGGVGVGTFGPSSLQPVIRKTNTNGSPYFIFRAGQDKQFAHGAVRNTSGTWLYMYSIETVDLGIFGKYRYLQVARAAIANNAFLNRSAWRFWNGSSWSSDISASYLPASSRLKDVSGDPIIIGGTISVAFNDYLGCYTMMYWGISDSPGAAYIRLADNPWGPWSSEIKVFDGPPGTSGNRQAFLAPWLSPNNGSTIVFSYYNGTEETVRLVRAFACIGC